MPLKRRGRDSKPLTTNDDGLKPPQPGGTGVSRRALLANGGLLAGGAAALAGVAPTPAQAAVPLTTPEFSARKFTPRRMAPGLPKRDYMPVVVPNDTKAPWKIVDGVKVFHLIAEEFEHEFAEGLKALCWGYNRQVNGPVLEMVEGDHVRIFLTNRLPAATSIHWHGFLIPNGMDGVGGLNQKAVPPGETYRYEFTLAQHGTLMYHSHHDEMTQMALGMTGMVVVHPRRRTNAVDRDFALVLHEWRSLRARRRQGRRSLAYSLCGNFWDARAVRVPAVVLVGSRRSRALAL